MERSEFRVLEEQILALKRELAEFQHKARMEELVFERESQERLHSMILERGRIQRAEEKKLLQFKSNLKLGRG